MRQWHFVLSPAIRAGLLALAACSHAPVITPNPTHVMPPAQYQKLFKKRTRHTDQYQGFYQTFQADVTILSTDFVMAGLDQRASALAWTPAKFASEREAAMQISNQKARFHLRFYSPDRENDDLDKKKTIWRVFLDQNGVRYDGTVKKLTEKLIELQMVYPNQNRFSSAYEVSFDVPMTTIEKAESTVTLTGSLGSAQFTFPPIE